MDLAKTMALKAILLDFNGIVINDEKHHRQLIEQIFLEENLRPDPLEIRRVCTGRSDRACLTELLQSRGRVVSDQQLNQLVMRKAKAYQTLMGSLEKLPIYPDLEDLIYRIRLAQLTLAIVSGACRSDIDWVLDKCGFMDVVATIISGDDVGVNGGKPEPDSYLLAIERLRKAMPQLQPADCLAIEDSFAGVEAAKRAGVPVVGVAHTYPYQMMHRKADWVVDYLSEIDLDWPNPRNQPTEKLSVGST